MSLSLAAVTLSENHFWRGAKVEFHLGELFPRLGFMVTNLETPSKPAVRFYNKRETAEQWIKEGKQAVKMTRLSCHRFRSNELQLWLSVIAHNLGNLWRHLALPKKIDNWSLTSLQQRLVKTGGRLVKHARYYWLSSAESHLTRHLFGSMPRRICAVLVPTGCRVASATKPRGEERAQGWSGAREMLRNWEFPSLHVSANRAVGLPSWKIMRRRTIWFTWKDFGCIRPPIRAVQMEIPDWRLF